MKKLSEEYLLLAKSKSLSFSERVFLKVYCLFSSETRKAFKEITEMEKLFTSQQKDRLAARLGISEVETSMNWGFKKYGAIGFASLCLLAIFISFNLDSLRGSAPLTYTAKGSELGVHLFAKGQTLTQLNEGYSEIQLGDTLQFVPLSDEATLIAIYGYSKSDGLYLVFPENGKPMDLISLEHLPPALVGQEKEDQKLLVVSSKGQLQSDELKLLAMNSLIESSNQNLAYEDSVYLQVFEVGVK